MNYQYGYIPQPYQAPYYPQAPSSEYLEHRRVSMPLSHYPNSLEDQYFNDQPPINQYRSNSMADAMNFNQFNWRGSGSARQPNAGPPGLVKHNSGPQNLNESGSKMFNRPHAAQEERQDTQDMNSMNANFAKMSLGNRPPPKRMHKSGGIMAATGEISCHSNSTIKEEDFDSERDAFEKGSDSSSNKAAYTPGYDSGFYMRQNTDHPQYYQSLVDDEFIRNQKRRESQQIPITSLDNKKIFKTPMKSTSVAFVPKTKDNRATSMPNIFQPFGNKEKYAHPGMQEGMNYYQFNPQGHPPGMMNFSSGMMSAQASQMAKTSDQYEGQMPMAHGNMGGLNPNLMPDYNYEERRNSGTTGGCSNPGKGGKLGPNSKPSSKILKKTNSGQYHNKSRRSSNAVAANITIPTNDKDVMDYKGQISSFAKTQQGSKYLQRVLAKASPDVLEFIVVEVGDHLHELMVDSYGNYFCQKLLQSSSSKQRLYLLQKINPHLVKIACDKRGTHSMQSLIQLINMEEEEQTLEDAIRDNVICLSFDPNGTHVLQKVLLTVKVNKLDYIFYECYDKLIELSLDANGLCVVKKLIARFSTLPDKRKLLVDKLSEN